MRHRDLDRMRHVNNVSTISLHEDGWARFVADDRLGGADDIDWRVDYLGINFRKELYYRDEVRVGTGVTGSSGNRLYVGQTLFRDGAPAGYTERIVTPIDRRTGEEIDLPDAARESARTPRVEGIAPGPFRPTEGAWTFNSATEAEADANYPLWREDIFRFADLDADEHVGRLAQLELIESARVGLIQDVGPPTPDPDNIWLAVHVALNFSSWPRYPGQARTGTRVRGFGRSSCSVSHTIYSKGRAIATGGAVVALAHRKTFQTIEIPEQLRERLANASAKNVPSGEKYDPARLFRD